MVTNNHMLSLRSVITQKLLNYFFINKHEKRYLNELARILDVDPKNLDTKLKELEIMGLFKSEFQGRQKYYYINKNFPLFHEYQKIIAKTIGVEYLIKNALKDIKGIEEVYIFGSYSKNQLNISSDIDLLIVGNHKALEVQRTILPIQNQLNREINVIDITKKELKEKKNKKNPFIKEIFSKPIIKII